MKTTTLVIPCHNEAQRLRVDEIGAYIRGQSRLRLLLVDDGSRDNTAFILDQLASIAPDSIRIMKLPDNVGKAEAVRTGMLNTFEHIQRHGSAKDAQYVGYWDADLATPLEAIAEFQSLLDRSEHLNLVMGSRIALLGHDIQRKTYRHVIGRVFATVASQVLSLPVYDTQCGAKLFRATPEIQLVFAQPFYSKWIFDVEILARMICLESSHRMPPAESMIAELPLKRWIDVPGSQLRARDFVKATIDLLRIGYEYRWRRQFQTPDPVGKIPAPKLQPLQIFRGPIDEAAGDSLEKPVSDRRAA